MSRPTDIRLEGVQQQITALKEAVAANAKALSKKPTDIARQRALAMSRRELVAAEQQLAEIRATITRETFLARAKDLRADLELLEAEIGQATLASMETPGDVDLMDRVESLRKQRDDLRASIDDIDLARRAADQRQVTITEEERRQRISDLVTLQNAAVENAIARCVELIDYGWAVQHDDGTVDTSRWDAFLDRMHKEGRITRADWQFAQGVWDLLEAMKPAAQSAHKRMFGHYFDEITAAPVQTPFGEFRGGYVPALTDSLLVPESRSHGAMDDMLASQNSPMFPAVGRGFTKARVENYTRPLALDLRLMPAHIDKVARFAVLGPVLRDTARLVSRNRTFTQAMNAADPQAIESMLVPWLKRTATQTLLKAPETQADRGVAKLANAARNRTGLLLMSANVINTLQQVTGLSVAALRVKPRHLAGGLLELVRNPNATGKAINELSPWMQQRTDEGSRDVDRAIDDLLLNPSIRQKAEQAGSRYGYALQQVAQNFLDRTVWLGAYRQAVAAKATEADAVRQADAAVRMTQSSFAPEDAAKVEHAGAFTRLFLQFYSYFSGQANVIATEVQNAQGRPARLALVYLLGFAVPAFLADLIAQGARGDLDGDDDEDALAAQVLGTFFSSQARYALAMLPIAGQAGNVAVGQLTPERFDDRIGASPAYSAIEATVRAPFSIWRAAIDDANPRTAVRDFLTAVAVLTGLPTGPLVRPLGYLADDRRDEDEISARGLVTGRAPSE